MTSAKGSRGPDGWTAEEIKHLPEGVAHFLKILSDRWGSTGCLPSQLKEVRQINLPKPGKILMVLCKPSVRVLLRFAPFVGAYMRQRGPRMTNCSAGLPGRFHHSVVFGKGSLVPKLVLLAFKTRLRRKVAFLLSWTGLRRMTACARLFLRSLACLSLLLDSFLKPGEAKEAGCPGQVTPPASAFCRKTAHWRFAVGQCRGPQCRRRDR